jgi:hypothetical protein
LPSVRHHTGNWIAAIDLGGKVKVSRPAILIRPIGFSCAIVVHDRKKFYSLKDGAKLDPLSITRNTHTLETGTMKGETGQSVGKTIDCTWS